MYASRELAVDDKLRLDITTNRAARKWSRKELAGRFLWALMHPLFIWIPRPVWGWRRSLLRLFGARIGREVHIYPTARITNPWNLTIGDQSAVGDRVTLYALGPITIGERVTISQGAHLCAGTHDHRDPAMPLLKPPIVVDHDTWICADAFIGPGVHVGASAVIGARCVVMKDVEPGAVMVGNPARVLRYRSEGA